ncbi:PfkB family carbohydrate kinase [bacterium]|nr:PfkB family carbohydrate kinase [bacterium]
MYEELNKKYQNKIISVEILKDIIGNFPRENKVIMCHGVFDVVHPGHIRHLAFAKSKSDILVVSITCDKYVDKGKYRPHVPENLRAYSLSAFEMVDYVIIDSNQTPLDNITILEPDLFAKGFEYSDDLPIQTKQEIEVLESYGGQVLFTPGDIVYSSSKLLNEHLPEIKYEKLLSLMNQSKINFDDLILNASDLKNFHVHVIGDTIVDTYTRTKLIGGNTKTPTFSVLYGGHDDYVGGAGIVARHLKAAGAKVTFTTVIGNDKLGNFVTKEMKDHNIKLNYIMDENRPTTNKNAFIAEGYRLLKVDTIDNTPVNNKVIDTIISYIENTDCDAVIFSDFRHGIFTKNSIQKLTNSIKENVLKIADSQVASRWGNITEFQNFDLVTPNEREARFALADQDSNIGTLASEIQKKTNCENVILKLGSRGAFFCNSNMFHSVDSFAENIEDPVGAGDALLAYASLMLLKTKSLTQACILGAVAAALECEYDGNIPIELTSVIEKLNNVKNKLG